MHPEFTHAEKVVVVRLVKIEESQPLAHQLIPVISECYLHALPHQFVLLPVGGGQGLRGDGGGDLPQGVVVGGVGQAGVEFCQLLAQSASQHYLAVRGPAQQTVGAEVLLVEGVDRLPAETLQVVGGGLLDEGGFGVVGHNGSFDP